MYVCIYVCIYVRVYVCRQPSTSIRWQRENYTLVSLHALHSIKIAMLAARAAASSKVAQTVDMLEASAYVGSARTSTLAAPALH